MVGHSITLANLEQNSEVECVGKEAQLQCDAKYNQRKWREISREY